MGESEGDRRIATAKGAAEANTQLKWGEFGRESGVRAKGEGVAMDFSGN